jgi:glucose-6-phosphate 1-dehydrogenase
MQWHNAREQVHYQQGQYDEPDGFRELNKKLAEKENVHDGPIGRLFYLSIPPSSYANVMEMIKRECSELGKRSSDDEGNGDGKSKCEQSANDNSWVRVVIEKPFGSDLESSEELADKIASVFCEDQIFRIDHFLGNELSQVCYCSRMALPSTYACPLHPQRSCASVCHAMLAASHCLTTDLEAAAINMLPPASFTCSAIAQTVIQPVSCRICS